MKYLGTIAFILITSVTFMYYLLNNQNFLPTNEFGNYNWLNILTLILLLFLAIFSFTNILTYLTISLFEKIRTKGEKQEETPIGEDEKKEELTQNKALKKNLTERKKIVKALKFSLAFTAGILTVFVLNFFNILGWIWGLSILIVVLTFIFII